MGSDESLHEQLLAGDLSAFDALYERHGRRLFGFVFRQLGDRQEAEDVVHDAFLTVLREGRRGRGLSCFRAWLFQVARNLCLNRRRSRQRADRAAQAASHVPPPPAAHPERALQDRETTQALQLAVRRLPEALAELFHLRAEGLSYDDLAQVLEVPVGTVKSRMHELVSRLREEMAR